MKNTLKIFLTLNFYLFIIFNQPLVAQPSNDECSGAIDISSAFMGNCGDISINGAFTLTGSTPGVDDPPEPGENEAGSTQPDGPFCPNETDPNLFGDDCGITNPLGGDSDTQVAIYQGACPTAATGECDHFAASEDLFSQEPWISGWSSIQFIPGITYYMGVDGWDGVQGEFCITVTVCGVECGNDICDPAETYCICEDCQFDEDGLSLCDIGDIFAIQYNEFEEAFLFSIDLGGNIFFCSEFVNGYASNNVYLGFGALNWTNCAGTLGVYEGINLSLSVGQFVNGATDNGDGTVNIPVFTILYIELTPEDIAAGSINITSFIPDGIGNICRNNLLINFADFPQVTNPYCNISCSAGGINSDLLENGLVVCEGEDFTLSTNGLEDLTLPCNSDDGSSYVYAWRVRADPYGTGDFITVTNWQILGVNPTINPNTFFIDEFGYIGPYYTPGYPISPNSVPILIQGAALCINADGSFEDGCLAANANYDSSQIDVFYVRADDSLCANNEMDCEGLSGGNALPGTTCFDEMCNCTGLYNDDCVCIGLLGCTDATACNYIESATEDDGSCVYPPNCETECIAGEPCTHQSGNAGFYGNNCKCYATVQGGNDECADAIDISEAFMGTCDDASFNGPFTLTGSTPGANDPPEPGENEVNSTQPAGPFCADETDPNLFGDDAEAWENSVWFTWTVPDLNGDGSPVAYSIWTSDGSFNDDCGINLDYILTGDFDTQVAIYEGACPTSNTGECDHYAASEDLFDTPPWVSGWLTLEFTPGIPYYMAVDGWDGAEGDFCLTVVPCSIQCGDDECAPVEDYCDCADCRNECKFSDVTGINIMENGDFASPNFEGNIFICAKRAVGYSNENVYLTIAAAEYETCDETAINLPLDLSVGNLLGTDEDGLDTLTQGYFSYIELTPEDIAVGSITITSNFDDGLGNNCTSSLTLNFDDYPQVTDPYCELECLAGGIETSLIDNGITVCEDEPFTLSTNGLEDLTLPCNSDDGSSYVYAWRVLADFYGTGEYDVVTSWQPLGPNPTIDPATFFVFDELGEYEYPTPDMSFFDLMDLQIEGAAICFDADGTIEDGCLAANDGYENSQIAVLYLRADDPLCSGHMGSDCTPPAVGNFDCEE